MLVHYVICGHGYQSIDPGPMHLWKGQLELTILRNIQSQSHTFLLIHVSYFKPQRDKDKFGKPVTVWEPARPAGLIFLKIPVCCVIRYFLYGALREELLA